MNDEIKEILDRLDYNEWDVDLYKVPITWCELYDIRDYITKLQQENERLKKDVELFKSDLISCTNTGLSLITKIDKTIEYINKQKKKMYKSRNKIALFILMKLENILQNGSENENNLQD